MRSDDAVSEILNAADKRILCLGSGDGSQQRAMVDERSHVNVTTTFFDTQEVVQSKYPCAGANISFLNANARDKCHFGVDATRLDLHAAAVLGGRGLFDVVMFYFPHSGVANMDSTSVASNQFLLSGFLATVKNVLKLEGTIQVALKTGDPYKKWGLPSLVDLSQAGLKVISETPVNKSQFPGYTHITTMGLLGSKMHRKEVRDDDAKLYEIGFDDAAPDSPLATLISEGFKFKMVVLTQANLSEAEVEGRVLQIITASANGVQMTVLDIRAQFSPSLRPDTRQMNRVLYALKDQGRILMGPPVTNGRSSQKPTWLVPAPSSSTPP